jgi:hypothetical protein
MPDPLIRFLKDLSGIARVQARLAKIADPDATPLMVRWMKIIDDDNRRGVLAGLDKDGKPMVPVTYRPAPYGKLGKVRKRGRGGYNAGVAGNLSSREYRLLDGPPLAPRGTNSRVITNLKTRYGRTGPLDMLWEAIGYWDDVVSRKGERFLHYHFDGATGGGRSRTVTLPQRDLRGVRPEGRRKAMEALRAWMIDVIRSA